MNLSRLEGRSPQRSRRRRARHQPSYTVTTVEIALKLAVNLGVCAVAAIALAHIQSDDRANREELRQVSAELQRTRARVHRAEAEFSRHFDPQQTSIVVQEQSHYSDPNQVRVMWSEDDR